MAEGRFGTRVAEEIRLFILDNIRRMLTGHAEQRDARIKTSAQFRTAALTFITNMPQGIARTRILQWYDEALKEREKGEDPLRENRIADLLAIIYGTCADDEERRKVFTDLGNSGDLNRALNFTEARRFFIAWLVVKKFGRDTWRLVADTWESIADYLERHPTGAKSFLAGALDSVMAEIREDRGRYDESAEMYEDGGSYRADIREWMQKQTTAMQEAHEERLARGDAEIVHRRRRGNLYWVVIGGALIVSVGLALLLGTFGFTE